MICMISCKGMPAGLWDWVHAWKSMLTFETVSEHYIRDSAGILNAGCSKHA